jgi:GNAT superfamily N-acetyltransferase
MTTTNLSNWIHFTWDLTSLPRLKTQMPEHYQIAPAAKEDEAELRRVITASFVLDPAWNPAMHEVKSKIDKWLDRAFESTTGTCLALRHGLRIIGAAVLSLDPHAENHLTPGPCILMEYRNRGFGTQLLESSLTFLREAGLSRAIGIARENVPVSRFLYTKFSGVPMPPDIVPALAA